MMKRSWWAPQAGLWWARRCALTVVSCAALVACGGDDGGTSVVPVPATVNIEVPTGRQPLGVALQLRSSVGALAEGLDLRWDFGDGKTSALSSPSHTYGAPGVYTVTLTVTNAAGDKVTGTSTVTVGDLAVAAGRVCNGPDQTGWCWQRPLPQGQTLNAFEFVSDAVGWAVGEGGTIMATRDGGKSWVAQRSGSSLGLREVRFVDALVGWAAGSVGEVFKTVDGGTTWQRMTLGVSEAPSALGAKDALVAWARVGSRTLITRDGGATWSSLAAPDVAMGNAIVVSATAYWVPAQGDLWRRTDTTEWGKVSLPAMESARLTRQLNTVQVSGSSTVLVRAYEWGYLDDTYWNYVSRNVDFVSTDGGATWAVVKGPDGTSLDSLQLLRDGTMLSTNGLHSAPLGRSTDRGRSWQSSKGPVVTDNPWGATVTGYGSRVLMWVSTAGSMFLSADGGASWRAVGAGGPGQDAIDSVWFFNSRDGLAIGRNGSYVKTRDGGLTWTDVAQPGATGWRRMQFLSGADTGWVISGSGTLFKSTDRGATWLSPVAATSATVPYASDFHFVDAKSGWAVTSYPSYTTEGSGVYQTSDGGNSWQPVKSASAIQGLATIRFADASNGVAMGPPGVAYVSSDGGATWRARPTGTDQRVTRVTFANANLAVAVGQGGLVLRSTDRGQTWQRVPSATAHDLMDVRFTSSSRGYAVGAGGTLLSTTDGGLNWTRRDTGVSYTLMSVFFVDAYTGWVSGEGGSILVTTDGG
ncbi:MAG: YCF48-related protein [Rubrivivax sp.]